MTVGISLECVLSGLDSQTLEEYVRQMADEESDQTNWNQSPNDFNPATEHVDNDSGSYTYLELSGSFGNLPSDPGNNSIYLEGGNSAGNPNILPTIMQENQIQEH